MSARKCAIWTSFITVLGGVTSASAIEKETALLTESASQKIHVSVAPTPRPTSSEPVVHVLEQSLPSFLRQAAHRGGYEITLSKRVRGVIQRKVLPTDIRKILPELAEQFGLKWHFQQKQLFVSVGSENTTRLIFLGKMSYEQLKEAMSQAGLRDDVYDMSFVEESNSITVNGSTSYITSIELITESFNKNRQNQESGVTLIKFGKKSN